MKILAFAASLRKGSLNKKLVALAADIARAAGAEVDLADFREFEMPIYDGDVDAGQGPPPGAQQLRRRVDAADAILISAPEYNYSIAGPLKNAIDWVSRARPMPWRGKSIYLMAAAPSPMGGIRGLWQTRIPLEGCGALVFPDMFALPHAADAFDEAGRLRDARRAPAARGDGVRATRRGARAGVQQGRAGAGEEAAGRDREGAGGRVEPSTSFALSHSSVIPPPTPRCSGAPSPPAARPGACAARRSGRPTR
jgi:chromate reductase, NAD(P)H dehydrogenase (quinone)